MNARLDLAPSLPPAVPDTHDASAALDADGDGARVELLVELESRDLALDEAPGRFDERLEHAVALLQASETGSIFILSRASAGSGAWEQSREQILATLDRLNPRDRRTGRRRLAIHTVQFIDLDSAGVLSPFASMASSTASSTDSTPASTPDTAAACALAMACRATVVLPEDSGP